MRVTQLETGRNLMTDLEKLNRSFAEANRQLSSGRKLNSLADSPLGSADLVDVTEQALRLEAYRFNLNASSYKLKSAESSLNEANNILASVYTLGSEAATGTVSSDSRLAIAGQILKLREELVSIGNNQSDGCYLFSGSMVDTAPFELNGNSVGYLGNETVISIPVGDGVEVVAGVSGSKALGATFAAIDGLIAAMETDDTNEISEALASFAGALSELGQARGQIGVSLDMVDRMSAMLTSRETVLREQRSNIEDANILEASVRINQLQTAINAALTSGGAILQQNNLFDIVG